MAEDGTSRETIKEYLIKIGHEVEGAEKAHASLNSLASSIRGVGAALAAVYSVKAFTDINRKVKELGEMSGTIGAPIASLRGMAQAADLVGIKIGAMQNALLTFAQKRREFGDPFVRSAERIAGTKLDSKDTTENFFRFVEAMKKNYPDRRRAFPAFKEVWGMESVDADFAMDYLDKMKKIYAERKKMEAEYLGDANTHLEKAKHFTEEWSHLMSRFGLAFEKLLVSPDVGKAVESLGEAIDHNKDDIISGLGAIANGIGFLGEKVAKFFTGIGQWAEVFSGKKSIGEAFRESRDKNRETEQGRADEQWWKDFATGGVDPKKFTTDEENTRATEENTKAVKEQKSIWESIKLFIENRIKQFGPAFGDGSGGAGDANTNGVAQSKGRGEWTPEKAAALIRKVGGTEEEAKILGAISQPESSGNARAHNPYGRDNSYGLWQINMLGDMGPERRRRFGLSSNEELFDPETNARAALAIARGKGGYSNWTTYSSGKYRAYLDASSRGAMGQPATANVPTPPRRDKVSSLHLPAFAAGPALGTPNAMQLAHYAATNDNSRNIGPFHTTVNVNGPNGVDATTLSRAVEKPMRQYASRIANIGSTLA